MKTIPTVTYISPITLACFYLVAISGADSIEVKAVIVWRT